MLTGLKVLSLASKCAFYRPENDAKGACKCVFLQTKA